MEKTKVWRKLNGDKVMGSLEEEIRMVLNREQALSHELKVCIGTDSQVKSRYTEFATVIVFLRKGKGGFMYIHSETSERKMSIKERMLLEVGKSIETAYHLSGTFQFYHVEMEVHVDINTSPTFKSNEALKEAMGYIVGMGYAFKAKPEAFASSSCADKIVH